MTSSHRPRVVITGGAGFLGSHMCDRLVSEGVSVVCVDNLLTGRLENISHLSGHSQFTFINADITRPLAIEGPLDYVLHLASPASPKDYAQYPIHTLKVGAIGTYNALGLAKTKGATFLLSSTSEVYGDPEVSPQPETYWGRVNPVGPRSVYDEAKRFAEAMTIAYQRSNDVSVRIARIFNTYGPRLRMDDGRALPTFITQAIRAEPLTVYGDGSQTRSFCYVDDLVDGLYRLMTCSPQLSGSDVDFIFNLGNPEEISVLGLAEKVIELTDSPSGIEFRRLPTDDPKIRCPDISRAEIILGWKPLVPITDGLQRVIPYFREQMKSGHP